MDLTRAGRFEEVTREDITLRNAALGYNINVAGEHAGSIEGVPGRVEYIEIVPHWEGKGVARGALQAFIDLSKDVGESAVTTNNATHPAMEHILRTEGFEKQSKGWVKEV
jgi:GNAT superfamily N-acetyltransferase